MLYIVATVLRKAFDERHAGWNGKDGWRRLMLVPDDYAENESALFHPLTRQLMKRIDFRHGGPEYDRKYPDGIPTTVEISDAKLGPLTSGLVMYPQGHARADAANLAAFLEHKFRLLTTPAVEAPDRLKSRFSNLATKSAEEIQNLYDFQISGVSDSP
jgi:2-methylcitrate dehydratase